jgi:hypothetical protein
MQPDDVFISYLEESGYDVYREGSQPPDDELPDDFFIYLLDDTEGQAFYDDRPEAMTSWVFDLAFYSRDPMRTSRVIQALKTRLNQGGYLCSGIGSDVGGEKDLHVGRALRVTYLETGVRNE